MSDLKTVLFFAPLLEYPPKGGPEVSVINAIKALNATSNLFVVTTVSSALHRTADADKFFTENTKGLLYLPSSRLHSGRNKVNSFILRLRRLLAPLFALIDLPAILFYAYKTRAQIFWVDRVLERAFYIFFFLRLVKPSSMIIGDTEAVHSRFILRELPTVRSTFRKFVVICRGLVAICHEKILIRLATKVTAVSSFDADFFKALSNGAFADRVVLFSNSVDLEDFSQHKQRGVHLKSQFTSSRPRLILMGSFGSVHSPMDQAADWLVNEIMPIVWKDNPSVEVLIAGRNSDLTQGHLASNNITVVGSVDDMVPYIQESDACVIPLRHESGTRFKIIQAGACGIPCISTSLGAEGLNLIHQHEILIADTTLEFAHAVSDLLRNKGKAFSLGAALQERIKSEYGLHVQVAEAQRILG